MSQKCFVLMPFAKDLQQIYDHAIKPAAEAAGFDCYRADHADGPSAIISDIIESIFKADVIVADLSSSNANVFYELGVAHAVSNKTIMICERPQDKLPFDLKAYRVIFYSKTVDGIREELRSRLERALRDMPHWSSRPSNPFQNFRPIQYGIPLQDQERLEKTIEQLKEELRGLRSEKRRGELRALIMSLREIEFRHLRNLSAEGSFNYVKRPAFLDELRKLRSLGLIRNKADTTIGGIPESGDLKQYIELTELTREVLDEMFRWVSQ